MNPPSLHPHFAPPAPAPAPALASSHQHAAAAAAAAARHMLPPVDVSATAPMSIAGTKGRQPDDRQSSIDYASGASASTISSGWPHLHHQQQQDQAGFASSHLSSDTYPAPVNAIGHASWQQQHHSARPLRALPYTDPAGYVLQPYLFPQSSASTANAYGSQSPWMSSGESSFPLSLDRSQPVAGPSQMPYFPPSATGGSVDAAPSPTGPQFPQGREIISQYDYVPPSQPSESHQLVTQASRTFDEASISLKMQSLSILENLAAQLIHTLAKANFAQIQDYMSKGESEDCQAFTTVGNLFEQTRRVYSRDTPFIDAIAIQMFQPSQQEIIRKANIATFISSILGAHDVSFFHLNEYFMETFVPLGHRLLKWQGAVFLELKTQAYISALINSDGRPEEMLDEIFPSDLDAQILTRHPDAPSLSPSESDFIERSRARKNYLLAEDPATAAKELPRKYQWADFVREFASSISKNVDGIMNMATRSSQSGGNNNASNSASAGNTAAQRKRGSTSEKGGRAKSSFAANGTAVPGDLAAGRDRAASDNGVARKPSVAATATVRQPWMKSEEDALLDGLARVYGPHWSQILALYGRGGSISEILKDRNQVQLKDKARNLKLWYLKMGKDVPLALQGVTGELRKRGGARARAALELQEAEEDVDADADGVAGDGAVAVRAKKKKGKGRDV